MKPGICTLDLGHAAATVHWETLSGMPHQFVLPWGLDVLAEYLLPHKPPRPLALEQVIEVVEEGVMPVAASLRGINTLVLMGTGAQCIAAGLAYGGEALPLLSLSALEQLFNRLVAVSEGRPTAQDSLPSDAHFVAAMTLLRECMHHWHIAEVVLPAPNH